MAPVYQRATAKLALFGFLYLQINNLRTKVAIDTPFKTKVLLRRLKRHWRRTGTDSAGAEAQSAPAVTIYREDGARRTRLRRTATALELRPCARTPSASTSWSAEHGGDRARGPTKCTLWGLRAEPSGPLRPAEEVPEALNNSPTPGSRACDLLPSDTPRESHPGAARCGTESTSRPDLPRPRC